MLYYSQLNYNNKLTNSKPNYINLFPSYIAPINPEPSTIADEHQILFDPTGTGNPEIETAPIPYPDTDKAYDELITNRKRSNFESHSNLVQNPNLQLGNTIIIKENGNVDLVKLNPVVVGFLNLCAKEGIRFKITEGYRYSTTKNGELSRHAEGCAIDITPIYSEGLTWDDLISALVLNPNVRKYMLENMGGTFDEFSGKNASQKGATGLHLHISFKTPTRNYAEEPAAKDWDSFLQYYAPRIMSAKQGGKIPKLIFGGAIAGLFQTVMGKVAGGAASGAASGAGTGGMFSGVANGLSGLITGNRGASTGFSGSGGADGGGQNSGSASMMALILGMQDKLNSMPDGPEKTKLQQQIAQMQQLQSTLLGFEQAWNGLNGKGFGPNGTVGAGSVALNKLNLLGFVDQATMGDKNFDSRSDAIGGAVDGVSSALIKSGNPYAMLAGTVLKVKSFNSKATGQTTQGYDVDINSSGYGTMGHMESKSERDFGSMIGLGGLNGRKILRQLLKRNLEAQMALKAANITDNILFEQEARMNSVDNVIQANQIALAGGVDTSLLTN